MSTFWGVVGNTVGVQDCPIVQRIVKGGGGFGGCPGFVGFGVGWGGGQEGEDIQGHSFLRSQPLQPTNREIAGIRINPTRMNERKTNRIISEYRAYSRYAPIPRGMNQLGNIITMFLRKTSRKFLPSILAKNLGATMPYPHGHALVPKWWQCLQMRPQNRKMAAKS